MNQYTPLGQRITAARLKMHYTIKQACEIWGFKQGKFVNWEYNGTIPASQTAPSWNTFSLK